MAVKKLADLSKKDRQELAAEFVKEATTMLYQKAMLAAKPSIVVI